MEEYDLSKEDVDEILESIREKRKDRKNEQYEVQPARNGRSGAGNGTMKGMNKWRLQCI